MKRCWHLALWRRWRPAAARRPGPSWPESATARQTRPAPSWRPRRPRPSDRRCGPSFQPWRTRPRLEATNTHSTRKTHTHTHMQLKMLHLAQIKQTTAPQGWKSTSGLRCASRMLPIRPSLWPRVLALLRDSMVFLILRLWRMGTSDMNSTPPATMASHWPAAIRPTPLLKINKYKLGRRRQRQMWGWKKKMEWKVTTLCGN